MSRDVSSTHYFTNWDDLAPSEIMNARKCRSVEKVELMPSPRVLQSHLPFHLLPPRLLNTAKVDIYPICQNETRRFELMDGHTIAD